MKLQGLSVIFALAIIPIILVLTYYIQLQVDTINLQTQYDTKLLNSTHGAMAAFELNTANEDLSSVSDSLRTIIEASYNVFINALCTNFGMSNANRAYIEPYIPSVLYTLYDGYYIIAPTQVPTVLARTEKSSPTNEKDSISTSLVGNNSGTVVRVGDEGVSIKEGGYGYTEKDGTNLNGTNLIGYGDVDFVDKEDYGQILYKTSTDGLYTTKLANAKLEVKNVLKSYMPYSARYKNTDTKTDITVIYTLDNYITIEGTVNEVYYTKCGYLLPKNNANNITNDITFTTNIPGVNDILKYSQEDAKEIIKTLTGTIEVKINGTSITANCGNYEELMNEKRKGSIDNDKQYELDKLSAVLYYVDSAIFSNWVYETLSSVKESDIVEISGIKYKTISGIEDLNHDFSISSSNIFNTIGTIKKEYKDNIAEIQEDSPFYQHKLNVIRASIQYNLNLAMSTYNNNSAYSFDYSMPVMLNSEWEQILTNPSIVSFMQGYRCGLKIYNNYMIVSSTNNEISVSPEHIYYVEKNKFNDGNAKYHKIDCKELPSGEDYLSFTSKEVKYDKIRDREISSKYNYDHQNYACYYCINDGNSYRKKEGTGINAKDIDIFTNSSTVNQRKNYYIAIGKERNNLYKMNAFDYSTGYEIIYNKVDKEVDPVKNDGNPTKLPLSKIKQLEIYFDQIKVVDSTVTTRSYNVKINGTIVNAGMYNENDEKEKNVLSTNIANSTQHIIVSINPETIASPDDTISYNSIVLDPDEKTNIKHIKVIYK